MVASSSDSKAIESYLGGGDSDTVDYLLGLVSGLELGDDQGKAEVAEVFAEYKSEFAGGADGGGGDSREAALLIESILKPRGAAKGKDNDAGKDDSAIVDSMKSVSRDCRGRSLPSHLTLTAPPLARSIEKKLLAKVHDFEQQQQLDQDSAPPGLHSPSERNALSALRGIVDASLPSENIHDSTLQSVLKNECRSDLAEAALWITENDLVTYQNHLASQLRAREEEAKTDKANKEKIFQNYGLRPVSTNAANLGPAKKKPQAKKSKEPQVRYHENAVVTSRGEKYVVVKDESQEWDGGSRGKVMSKGKRGKGFT